MCVCVCRTLCLVRGEEGGDAHLTFRLLAAINQVIERGKEEKQEKEVESMREGREKERKK